MKTWRMQGMAARAISPIWLGSTGTSRQPSSRCPSPAIALSTVATCQACSAGSGDRKTIPTA